MEVKPEPVEQLKNAGNVSKVMLNVSENETGYVSMETDTSGNWQNNSEIRKNNNTTIHVNYSAVEKMAESIPIQTKPKKVSIVDFTKSDPKHDTIDIDTNDVSKQVNQIIDEAVKINEEKLNAKNNEQSNKQNNEINNNNESNCDHSTSTTTTTHEKNKWAPKQNEIEIIEHLNSENIKSNDTKTNLVEIPIQPILHESRTFDFNEYNTDNSLAVSSTSTRTETPSTGPNSLITSDIEDGYKGNDQHKSRIIEATCEESKEDFIESQFGFLSEHENFDSQTNTNENDDEKDVETIVSSTMIYDNSIKESPSIIKKDVINELTHFINSNRLDSFIRSNNESNNSTEENKVRHSLSNFHIGAYTNGNSKSHTISSSNSSTSDRQQSIDHENNVNNVPDKEQEAIASPKIPIGRSMSFHSTFASLADHDENTNGTSIGNGTSRSISYVSLNGPTKSGNNSGEEKSNEFNKMPCKKSPSELSIADTPSLQSIEVMKLILNKSHTLNRDGVPSAPKKTAVNQEIRKNNQRNVHENELKQQTNDVMAPSKLKTETKTWKYQGPPSVNLSTWGERPKSLVHIKNDDDYIFGARSKVVDQKNRFSETNGDRSNNNVRPSDNPFQKVDENCKSNMCKLPVVRGVEYKKNSPTHKDDSTIDDIPDSVQQSLRSNYKISRIVAQRPLSVCTTSLNQNANQNFDQISREKSFPSVINRVQSFNGQHEAIIKSRTNSTAGINEKNNSTDIEKPIFSQFTLRKTGLKEKILDESNSKKTVPVDNHYKKNAIIEPKANKIECKNKIPTAPKPPPILAKPINRPKKADSRDELLDSIRNFNRDTLKRKCIY